MAFFKCYDRARSIVVSTYPDRSNILSIPRFRLICLSPHTLLIDEYPDLLNFSTSKHELNRCPTHPHGGETGDSSPYCWSSRHFSSHLRPWLATRTSALDL